SLDEMGPFAWGDVLNLAADVRNAGDTDTGAFNFDVVFSEDNTLDGSDVILDTISVANVAAGQLDINDISVTLPASGADGQKYLFLVVDPAESITEIEDTNNESAMPIENGSGDVGRIETTVHNIAVNSAGHFAWGDAVNLAADVKNLGDTDSGDFGFDIVLSQDDVLDGSDVILDSILVSSLAASGASANDISVTLPASGADGQNYLFMVVDPANTVTEFDENNNMWMMPVEIGSGDPPPGGGIDLEVAEFSPGAGPFNWGDALDIVADVRNAGDTASGAFSFDIVLSEDNILDGSDVILDTISVTNVTADEIITHDVAVTLPASGTDGQKYLIMVIDPSNAVTESVEDNNDWITMIDIGSGDPPPGGGIDLEVEEFNLNGTGPFGWGDALDLAADVRNSGDTDSGAFSFNIVLSEDDIVDGSDVVLDTISVTNVAAGQIGANDISVTLPASGTDGQKYLIMAIDPTGSVTEIVEDNNDWIMPIQIGSGDPPPTGGIDLVADDEEFLPPIDLVWGEQYDLPVDVFNDGDTEAGAFTITVVLSVDANYDGGDFVLANVPVTGIAPYGESINDVIVTLPDAGTFANGTYNIIYFADSAEIIEETNETNNLAVQSTEILDQSNLLPGVDLAVFEFDDDANENIEWGQNFDVAVDIINLGDTDAGSFTITIALSSDMNFDQTDTVVGTQSVASLTSGATSINDVNITLPEASVNWVDGNYYLVVSVDSENTVTEVDETNNFDDLDILIGSTGGPGGGIELQVDSFSVEIAGAVNWGDSLNIGADVINIGDTEAGSFTVQILFSQDDLSDASDTVAYSFDVASLGASQTYTHDFSYTLPTEGADGDYYFIMVVDSANTVTETNEDDNDWLMPVHIGEGGTGVNGIELFVEGFTLNIDGPIAWGDMINVDATVANVGDTDAGAFDVTIYFSEDDQKDAADAPLHTFTINELVGGTISTNNVDVTLPAAGTDGSYFLLMEVDSSYAVTEVNEDDNLGVQNFDIGDTGGPTGGIELQPDEFVPSVEGPVNWGDTVNLIANVVNIGDTDAGEFTVDLLFSEDDQADQNDTTIHSYIVTSLAAGTVYEYSFDYTIPTEGTDGQYHLIMVVDKDNTVTETTEDDNEWVMPFFIGEDGPPPQDQIELQAADFQITGQEPFNWNNNVDLLAEVENVGNLESGTFDITIYFSADDMIDGGDQVLHTATDLNLAGGASWSNNLSITLPESGTDGDYFLILEADSGHAVTEMSEEDNIAVQTIQMGAGGPSGQVDLAADDYADFLPPYDLVWGDQYEIAVDAFNLGDSEVGAFTISVVLSADAAYDGGDYLLTDVPVTGIAPFGESINDVLITLPAAGALPNGTYNTIIFVDSADVIAEADETNNLLMQAANISDQANLEQGVDLTIIDIDEGDSVEFQWDQTYTLSVDVMNLGDTDADAFTITVSLSTDENFDQSDTIVGTCQASSLISGGSLMFDIDVTLPFADVQWVDGLYFLVASADSDNVITEADEDNNFDDLDIFIGDTGGPGEGVDLEVDTLFVDLTQTPVMWGDTLNIDADVANNGDTESGSFTVKILYSADDMPDGGDTEIENYQVTSLAAGQVYAHNFDYTLPVEGVDGEYFLIMVVDGDAAVTETNEDNNEMMITLFVGEGGVPGGDVDLVADDEDFLPPMGVQWGQQYELPIDVVNNSEGDADPFTISVVLSADANWDASDYSLAEVQVQGLAPWASSDNDVMVTLPTAGAFADGDYYVIYLVDSENVIAELDENNNLALQLTNIAEQPNLIPGIDLAIMEYDIDFAGDFQWGNDVSLVVDLVNQGDTDASAFTTIVALSTDMNFDGSDTVLHTFDVPMIATADSSINDLIVTLPMNDGSWTDGMYYLVLAVDSNDAISEADETNNFDDLEIYIGSGGGPGVDGIDLIADDEPLEFPMDLVWGLDYELPVDAFNMGNQAAGAFTIHMVLSADNQYDGSDY
ncbi:MAG: hypothetical protein GY869_31800, partial [Planctomycetes bacterium]|nr:hypothetical protein [Planctomycetota bacterium]